ncbi:MAG: hypothetical protein V4658_12075 [Bacteroidota bacterium]
MIKAKYKVLFVLAAVMYCMACNNNKQPVEKEEIGAVSTPSNEDSMASCISPQKYPNSDKPMALMMRQMADNAQAMKELIIKGEAVTAQKFPFIRFHLVEPTDPDVLQPQFYENARLFQEAHKALVNAKPGQQKEMYNLYINRCIGCHEHVCSGPLKRIRKLVIE